MTEQERRIRIARARQAQERTRLELANVPAAAPAPASTLDAPQTGVLEPRTGQVLSREPRSENRHPGWVNGVRNAFQGVTLGAGDEIIGTAAGLIDSARGFGPLSETVPSRIEDERARIERFREDAPVTATAAEIGGALALPVGGLLRGASLARKAVAGGGIGGATGAGYGFNAAEGGVQERAQAAIPSAAFGAAAGAAAPYVVGRVQQGLSRRATNKALDATASASPSVDDLRAQSSALFERARQRGVVVGESAFSPLVDDMTRVAAELGVDRDVTPAAAAALRRFTDAASTGKGVSLRDLDILRRVASNASTSSNRQDRTISGRLIEMTDDFVARLMDSDLDAGTAQGLSAELVEARQLWKQMRNSEMIGEAIEKAKNQASGFENGIRIQFRQILANKKLRRTLSEGEIAAMEQVVQGSPKGNLLKRMSKMGFGRGQQTNVLGGMVGGGLGGGVGASIGGAIAGPPGAVVGGAIGSAATAGLGALGARGAERATLGLAQRAQGISAAGGVPQMPRPVDLVLLDNALARIARAGVPSAISQ